MKLSVHLPPDFEQRDDIRTLARVFRRNPELVADAPGFATLAVLRLWLDWARVGVEWRALQQARSESRNWAHENLAHLLAECCGWPGDPAYLITSFLEAGVISVVGNGDLDGLVLSDFAAVNPHLLPGHETIQSKGGRIKAEKRRADEEQQLAAQQARVMEQQGLSLFSASENVTADERQKCIALVMGFDGACGHGLRSSKDYVADEALMRDALVVLRGNPWDDVVLVQRYIRAQRENPEVVKETGAILRGFGVYLGKARR